MAIPFRQASFAGGEIHPRLVGRSDVARYGSSAALVENFIPLPLGPLAVRPGFEYLANTVPLHTGAAHSERLIPFVFSSDQSYELVFGDGFLRIFKRGVPVQAALANVPVYDPLAVYPHSSLVKLQSGGVWHIYRATMTGAQVEQPGTGTLWEIETNLYLTTPYRVVDGIDLRLLRFAQCGDVLTLTHPSVEPQELRRLADDHWELVPVSFSADASTWIDQPPKLKPQTDGATAATAFAAATVDHPAQPWQWQVTQIRRTPDGQRYETSPLTLNKVRLLGYPLYNPTTYYSHDTPPAWDSATSYTVNKCCRYGTTNYRAVQASTNIRPTDLGGINYWVPVQSRVSSEARTGAWYKCVVTPTDAVCVGQDTVTGPWLHVPATTPPAVEYEASLISGAQYVVDAVNPMVVSWPYYSPFIQYGDIVIAHRVYRGRGGTFGWLEDVPVATDSYTDTGKTPDYTIQPPQNRNPFASQKSDGSYSYEHPSCVAFYEQRRVFASTEQRPGLIVASRVGDFSNFDKPELPAADDPLELELASLHFEEIRGLLPWRRLLAFTSESEWSVGGAGGDPLSLESIDARPHSSNGSLPVAPLLVDNVALYATRGGKVREFRYSADAESYGGQDLSMLTGILDGMEVVEWAWQRSPNPVLWVLLVGGRLVSLTYDREQEVVAWARHSLPFRFVKSLCVVPEGGEDSLYILTGMLNSTATFLERLASPNALLPVYLDCATVVESVAPKTTVEGLGRFFNKQVHVVGDGRYVGAYEVSAYGVVDFSDIAPLGCHQIVVGLAYDATLGLLPLASGDREFRTKSKTILKCIFEIEAAEGTSVQTGESLSKLTATSRKAAGTNFVESSVENRWNREGVAFLKYPVKGHPITVIAATREVQFGGI